MSEKLSPQQASKRDERIDRRMTQHQMLSREHAITRGIAVTALQVLQRGFFGRLCWLLRGR